MNLELNGKKALVMGSSSGIGRAIAEALIKEGATVALCARNRVRLEQTAQELGTPHHFVCDLTHPGHSRTLVEKTARALEGLDILVTNSGGPKKGPFLDIGMEQWTEDYQNVWLSVVEALQVALPQMKQNRFGRILMVTSLAAKEPLTGLTTSNGLRAGLSGLAKSIANEVASFGITVNCLLPGYTNTERLKELSLTPEQVRQRVPMGRLAEPEEVAALAAFLASARAGYITGQSLVIDGGATRSY